MFVVMETKILTLILIHHFTKKRIIVSRKQLFNCQKGWLNVKKKKFWKSVDQLIINSLTLCCGLSLITRYGLERNAGRRRSSFSVHSDAPTLNDKLQTLNPAEADLWHLMASREKKKKKIKERDPGGSTNLLSDVKRLCECCMTALCWASLIKLEWHLLPNIN